MDMTAGYHFDWHESPGCKCISCKTKVNYYWNKIKCYNLFDGFKAIYKINACNFVVSMNYTKSFHISRKKLYSILK